MRRTLKIVSWALIATLSLDHLSYAAPEIQALNLMRAPVFRMDLPESVASVESSDLRRGSPTVFLLQDAHTNSSGQMNIARTLEYLANKEKVRYVFLEAGTGDDSLSRYRALADKARRGNIAKSFMMQGELSGAEYLDVSSDLDIRLWGVEEKSLYFKALEAYKAVAEHREDSKRHLDQARLAAADLKADLFNPDLAAFDAKRMAYLSGHLPLGEYAEVLFGRMQRHQVPPADYPSLSGLSEIKKLESAIDFTKANEEQRKVLASLDKVVLEELLGDGAKANDAAALQGKDQRELFAFYEALSEKVGGFESQTELKKYLQYLDLARAFSARGTLDEIASLEGRIYTASIRTDDEARLHRADEAIRSLNALLDLKMTPSEYSRYKKEGSGIDEITGLLNRKIADLDKHLDRAILRKEDFETYVQAAERFYELTLERDRKFVSNLKEKMGKEGVTKAAFLAGGYHAPNLKELFNEAGLSFVSIQPAVFHETNQKRYEKLLFERAKLSSKSIISVEQKDKFIMVVPSAEVPAAAARLASALNPDRAPLMSVSSPGARLADNRTLSYWDQLLKWRNPYMIMRYSSVAMSRYAADHLSVGSLGIVGRSLDKYLGNDTDSLIREAFELVRDNPDLRESTVSVIARVSDWAESSQRFKQGIQWIRKAINEPSFRETNEEAERSGKYERYDFLKANNLTTLSKFYSGGIPLRFVYIGEQRATSEEPYFNPFGQYGDGWESQEVTRITGPAYITVVGAGARLALPESVRSKVDPDKLSPPQLEALELLISLRQEHLLTKWSPADQDLEKKAAFFDQIGRLNRQYPGGLVAYQSNARRLLEISKKGENPLLGYTPRRPKNGIQLSGIDGDFARYSEIGLRNANKTVVVAVAGGLGDRLGGEGGYTGIKLAIPTNLVTNVTYGESFARSIEAAERESNRLNGESRQIPFVIMVSDETLNGTRDLMARTNNLGMTEGLVTPIKQEEVPAVINNDADFTLAANNPYALAVKPHGHGDVHLLIHMNDFVSKWMAQGYEHIVFIQDTNGQVMNGVWPALGVSIEKGWDMNFLTVPREAKEAAGSIADLVSPDGSVITGNVEYNQIDPLLRQTVSPEGDVADPETGKSPFPGNLNVMVLSLDAYAQTLQKTNGVVKEIINPKYSDAEKTTFPPGRLESSMQDIAFEMGGMKVGFTDFSDKRLVFSPVKNKISLAATMAPKGNYPDAMATGEADLYKTGRMLLKRAGVDVDVEGTTRTIRGIPFQEGAKVVLSPDFAVPLEGVAQKVRGGSISSKSALAVSGKNIQLRNLKLDGSLIIRVADGVELTVRDLSVQNQGAQFRELTDQEMESPSPALKIRGYALDMPDPMVIDIREPGIYEVGPDGAVRKIAGARLADVKAIAEDLTKVMRFSTIITEEEATLAETRLQIALSGVEEADYAELKRTLSGKEYSTTYFSGDVNAAAALLRLDTIYRAASRPTGRRLGAILWHTTLNMGDIVMRKVDSTRKYRVMGYPQDNRIILQPLNVDDDELRVHVTRQQLEEGFLLASPLLSVVHLGSTFAATGVYDSTDVAEYAEEIAAFLNRQGIQATAGRDRLPGDLGTTYSETAYEYTHFLYVPDPDIEKTAAFIEALKVRSRELGRLGFRPSPGGIEAVFEKAFGARLAGREALAPDVRADIASIEAKLSALLGREFKFDLAHMSSENVVALIREFPFESLFVSAKKRNGDVLIPSLERGYGLLTHNLGMFSRSRIPFTSRGTPLSRVAFMAPWDDEAFNEEVRLESGSSVYAPIDTQVWTTDEGLLIINMNNEPSRIQTVLREILEGEYSSGARLSAEKPASEALRRHRERIDQQAKDKQSTARTWISRRNFIAAVALGGSAAASYRFFSGDETQGLVRAQRNDLWINAQPQADREGSKALIKSAAEWLRANGYPRMDIVDEYAAVLDTDRYIENAAVDMPFAKQIGRDGERVEVFTGHRTLAQRLATIQRANSQSLYVEMVAGQIVREAWGFHLMQQKGTRLMDPIRDINIIEREYKAIPLKDDPAPILEYLKGKSAEIRRIFASVLSAEYYELINEVDFLAWAERKGIFSLDAVDRSLEATDGTFDSAVALRREYVSNRNNEEALFAHLLASFFNIYAEQVSIGAKESGAAVIFALYVLSEMSRHELTAGKEGLAASLANPLLGGLQRVTTNDVLSQAKELRPLADVMIRPVLERLPSGARLAAAAEIVKQLKAFIIEEKRVIAARADKDQIQDLDRYSKELDLFEQKLAGFLSYDPHSVPLSVIRALWSDLSAYQDSGAMADSIVEDRFASAGLALDIFNSKLGGLRLALRAILDLSDSEPRDTAVERMTPSQIESALKSAVLRGGAPYLSIKQIPGILEEIRSGQLKQGEIVDVVDGYDKIIARIGREIAHKYGVRHRTANAMIKTPDGKYILQVRAQNKKVYPYGLAAYGGHALAGETYQDAVHDELVQEFGFPADYKLQGRFMPLGAPGSFASPEWDKKNVELRSWDVYEATEVELELLRQNAAKIESDKRSRSREEFEKLQADQAKEKNGEGEVYAIVELTLDQILAINMQGYLDITHRFADGEQIIRSEPTADALAVLLQDPNVVGQLKEVAGSRLSDIGGQEPVVSVQAGLMPNASILSPDKTGARLSTVDKAIAYEKEFFAPEGRRASFEGLFKDGNNERGGWVHRGEEILRTDWPEQIEDEVGSMRDQGVESIGFIAMGGEASIIGPNSQGIVNISSTSPAKFKRLLGDSDLSKMRWFIVSKSGSTKETTNNARYLESLYGVHAKQHITYVTDSQDATNKLAPQKIAEGFRVMPRELNGQTSIGGRNTLMNWPTLIAYAWRNDPRTNPGVVRRMIQSVVDEHSQAKKPADRPNPWILAGIRIAELTQQGRYKLAILQPERIRESQWVWQQQNPEESVGKNNKGFTVYTARPALETLDDKWIFVEFKIEGESDAATEAYVSVLRAKGQPVITIPVSAGDRSHTPQRIAYGWMTAVVSYGREVGNNPSDQPQVEAYKKLMRSKNLVLSDAIQNAGEYVARGNGLTLVFDGLVPYLSSEQLAVIGSLLKAKAAPAEIYKELLSFTRNRLDAQTLAYYDDMDDEIEASLSLIALQLERQGYAAKIGEGSGVLHGLFVNWDDGSRAHQIPVQIVSEKHVQPNALYTAGADILKEAAVAAHMSLVTDKRPSVMLIADEPITTGEKGYNDIQNFFSDLTSGSRLSAMPFDRFVKADVRVGQQIRIRTRGSDIEAIFRGFTGSRENPDGMRYFNLNPLDDRTLEISREAVLGVTIVPNQETGLDGAIYGARLARSEMREAVVGDRRITLQSEDRPVWAGDLPREFVTWSVTLDTISGVNAGQTWSVAFDATDATADELIEAIKRVAEVHGSETDSELGVWIVDLLDEAREVGSRLPGIERMSDTAIQNFLLKVWSSQNAAGREILAQQGLSLMVSDAVTAVLSFREKTVEGVLTITPVLFEGTNGERTLDPIIDPAKALEALRADARSTAVSSGATAADVVGANRLEEQRAEVYGVTDVGIDYAVLVDASADFGKISDASVLRAQLEQLKADALSERALNKRVRVLVSNIPQDLKYVFDEVLSDRSVFVDRFDGPVVVWSPREGRTLLKNEVMVFYKDFKADYQNSWMRLFGASRGAMRAIASTYQNGEFERSRITSASLEALRDAYVQNVPGARSVSADTLLRMLMGQAKKGDFDLLAIALDIMPINWQMLLRGAQLTSKAVGAAA